MSDIFAPDVNFVPARNVYPTAQGGTLGSAAASMSPDTASASNLTPGSAQVTSAPTGMTGHPIAWWIALAVLFAGFVFVGRKVGDAGEFSNVRVNGYNILAIGFASVLFISAAKILLTRYRVPGLTPLIQAV